MFRFAALAAVSVVALSAPEAPLFDLNAKVVDTQAAMIAHVNSLNTTWTAGVNPLWSDHTWSNIKNMCGSLKGGPVLPKRPVTEADLKLAANIPTDFDPRTQWPQCKSLNEIRDQAACGSCWAFGAVEAMTDRICIASNGADQSHLSAQDMNSCCGSCGFGCGGGYPSSAWQYYQSTGVVTGANYNVTPTLCYPYSIPTCDHHLVKPIITPCGAEVNTPTCTSKCVDGESWASTKKYASSIYSLDMTTVYNDLMTKGPIESSFIVYSDFPTYTGGVYQQTSNQELGGHAIKIIGWGVESGTPYWLVANSWNPDWGLKGFFKILRGQDECEIEDGFVAGIPK